MSPLQPRCEAQSGCHSGLRGSGAVEDHPLDARRPVELAVRLRGLLPLLVLLLLLGCVAPALSLLLTVGVEVTGGDSRRRDSLVTATRVFDALVLLLLLLLLLLLPPRLLRLLAVIRLRCHWQVEDPRIGTHSIVRLDLFSHPQPSLEIPCPTAAAWGDDGAGHV